MTIINELSLRECVHRYEIDSQSDSPGPPSTDSYLSTQSSRSNSFASISLCNILNQTMMLSLYTQSTPEMYETHSPRSEVHESEKTGSLELRQRLDRPGHHGIFTLQLQHVRQLVFHQNLPETGVCFAAVRGT